MGKDFICTKTYFLMDDDGGGGDGGDGSVGDDLIFASFPYL